jgi:aspartate carbamoyltransferase catalytic subunit
VDSPQAVITAQVESGVVVRMAVLYELLAGANAPPPLHSPAEIAGAAAVGGGRLA